MSNRSHLFSLFCLSVLISQSLETCIFGVRGGRVTVCEGEGPRYGDFKCNHDGTHRICATLVKNETASKTSACEALNWGEKGSFWQITGQERWNWKKDVCGGPNPGTNWCICMWAYARLIDQVGCDNTYIDCHATDIDFIMERKHDGRYPLDKTHECLRKKCPTRFFEAKGSVSNLDLDPEQRRLRSDL